MPSVPSQTVGVIHIDGEEELPFAISDSRSRFDAAGIDVKSAVKSIGRNFPETIYVDANRLAQELNESYRVIARRWKLV